MKIQLNNNTSTRPLVYIETTGEAWDNSLNGANIAAGFVLKNAEGMQSGYLYGTAKTDITFKALVIKKIMQGLAPELTAFCRGLLDRVKDAATEGRKEQHNYGVLKPLANACSQQKLSIIESPKLVGSMCEEQKRARILAKDVKFRYENTQTITPLQEEDEYMVHHWKIKKLRCA